jgi:type VI secretion system protein ImpB
VAKEGSVAPKERVNIVYKPATGNAQEEVELPLKILMMGDYTGRVDDRPLEERKPINIDKDNFESVLESHKLGLALSVPEHLSGHSGAEMAVTLKFESLKDFTPEGVVKQVPELQMLLELRTALSRLKGSLANIPAFRKKLVALIADVDARKQLMTELGIVEDVPNPSQA